MMRLRATRKSQAPTCSSGFHQAHRFDQFVEDFLEDVLGVAWIGDAATDEVCGRPRLLAARPASEMRRSCLFPHPVAMLDRLGHHYC